jgi:hypothetical protein
MMNCFTASYDFLRIKGYKVPDTWNGWNYDNPDCFVMYDKDFLKRRDHIAFFKSFCDQVENPEKDDIVLTRSSVGIALNGTKQWIYSEVNNKMIIKAIKPNSIIMRVNNG